MSKYNSQSSLTTRYNLQTHHTCLYVQVAVKLIDDEGKIKIIMIIIKQHKILVLYVHYYELS